MSFRFYQQLESNDCGPTCVKMVAYSHGKNASLNYIKSFCEYTKTGTSVKDLIYCLNKIGMAAVAVNTSFEKLKSAPLPAILYWENKHFVVLYKVRQTAKNNYFYIADPNFGKIRIEQETFIDKWQNNGQGIAILAEPSDDVKIYGEKEKNISFFEFANKYNSAKLKLFTAFFFLVIATLINWFIPQIFQKIIDQGINASDINVVYKLAVIQGVLIISYLLASNMSSIILMRVNLNVGLDYLENLLKKYMRLPISFFESKLRTDLILRLEDQNRMQSFLTYKVLDFIYYFLNFLVFSTLLLYYSTFIFFVFFILSVLSFVWTLSFLKKRKLLDYKRFAEQSKNNNIVYEIVNGMPEIKISNDEKNRLDLWNKSQMEINKISLKALMLNYYQLWGANVFDKIRDVFIIIIASSLVINNLSSLGVLMTITYIIGQLAGSLDRIHLFIREMQDANISLKRLSEIYSKKEEPLNGNEYISDKIFDVEIDNISFRYPGLNSPYIIKGLSLEMKPGTITAIVGNSGCGKTTFVKLLLGFHSPQKGNIIINKKNIRDVSISEWRNRCGCVLQDGYVFSDTVSRNVAMGSENIDSNRLEFVCKIACIHDYIMTLPLKYDTVIGNSGLELSGGQKQRLLIARALYKNPDYLIFDEATSSLDTENEAKIMSNLYDFFHDKSMLIIAHRLSTVVRADKILFMENGTIVEQGTHKELCEMKGSYYKLVKNQIQLI